MNDVTERPLPGITVTIGPRAVRVSSEAPLAVLSSAVVGGGRDALREILNVHVDDKYDGERPEEDLAAVAAELGIRERFVGLMTAAYTEYARCDVESQGEVTVAAVVSIGLSNTTSAGVTPPIGARPADDGHGPADCAAAPGPGTINVILLVDAALTSAAMVNAVITATEAKTMTLAEWASERRTATRRAARRPTRSSSPVPAAARSCATPVRRPWWVGWRRARCAPP